MEGWIKLYRKLIEDEMYFEERFDKTHAWIDLLFLANIKPRQFVQRGVVVPLEVGDVAIPEEELAERWRWCRNSVRKYIKTLEATGKVSVKRCTIINVIHIVKFEDYQQNYAQLNSQSCAQLNAQLGEQLKTPINTGIDAHLADSDAQLGEQLGAQLNAQLGEQPYKKEKKYNNILTASKNFEDGDDFKSQILSQLQELQSRLDEQEKTKKPTTKKAASPLVTRGREIFEKRYTDLFGEGYYWQAKDAAAMVSLTKKITYSRKQKGMPIDDGEVLKALEAFLASITDEWLLKNFSVTNINSKYNEIVAQARAKMNYGKTNRQNLCDKRRSSEVTALTAKDYEGSF